MEHIPEGGTCPVCGASLSGTESFCPRCGAKLALAASPISRGKLIVVYLVSFFLAPFGLGYAVKYLRHPDPRAKRVGVIVIVITIVAVAFMIWITGAFTSWEYQSINSLGGY